MRILLALLLLAAPVLGADAKPKKIVLIAGKKSHGPVGNGQHDYGWNVLLLRALLESSNVKDRIRVEHHLDGWPADDSSLDDADTVMVISDGRDGDKYAEALHIETDARVERVDRLMKRGCGLVTFHFSTFAPQKHADKVLDWNGGYFQWETEGKRKWFSAIKTVTADVKPGTPDHPIWRGLPATFNLGDEFYYKLRFRDNDSRWQPILLVPALGGTPAEHTVAWAVHRPDGGRGFGTTAGHKYDNWKNDAFRRLILNAVVWSAKVEVPEKGVESEVFTHDRIRTLLGDPAGKPKAEAERAKVLMFAGNAAHKWHNWERTTPAIQAALEKDERLRVDVSMDIEDLGKRKLSDYRVILLNSWCNWQDPKPLSEASRKALVEFLQGGGGLVLVHFANGAYHFSLPKAGESDWPEYRKIVRRVWNHHGTGDRKSGHDAFGKFTVKPTAAAHEITAGLAEFEVVDELYFRQDGDEPIEPLITARSKVTGRDEPLAWTYTYGKARVFQTMLGHSEKTYDSAQACEMLRRATAWSAGLPTKVER